jgi:hypothetical protein
MSSGNSGDLACDTAQRSDREKRAGFHRAAVLTADAHRCTGTQIVAAQFVQAGIDAARMLFQNVPRVWSTASHPNPLAFATRGSQEPWLAARGVFNDRHVEHRTWILRLN